jgi:hypothetical protein
MKLDREAFSLLFPGRIDFWHWSCFLGHPRITLWCNAIMFSWLEENLALVLQNRWEMDSSLLFRPFRPNRLLVLPTIFWFGVTAPWIVLKNTVLLTLYLKLQEQRIEVQRIKIDGERIFHFFLGRTDSWCCEQYLDLATNQEYPYCPTSSHQEHKSCFKVTQDQSCTIIPHGDKNLGRTNGLCAQQLRVPYARMPPKPVRITKAHTKYRAWSNLQIYRRNWQSRKITPNLFMMWEKPKLSFDAVGQSRPNWCRTLNAWMKIASYSMIR